MVCKWNVKKSNENHMKKREWKGAPAGDPEGVVDGCGERLADMRKNLRPVL